MGLVRAAGGSALGRQGGRKGAGPSRSCPRKPSPGTTAGMTFSFQEPHVQEAKGRVTPLQGKLSS